MSDAKSGITDIFRQVNKLTHIDIKSIKEYANKLKRTCDNADNTESIKQAINTFHNDIKNVLDNLINTVNTLKKIKD